MDRILFVKWSWAAATAFALNAAFVYAMLLSGPVHRQAGMAGIVPAAGAAVLTQPRCLPALARRDDHADSGLL